MRLSRFAAGMIVLGAAAIIPAGTGCSSAGSSGFPPGADGGGVDASSPTTDATTSTPGNDARSDSPILVAPTVDSGGTTSVSHEAGFSDAKVQVDGTSCVADAGPAGPGPVLHTCIIFPASGDDNNECDGHHDPPAPFPANGSTGNGFDDNCNGLVDEGCSCTSVGTTKPCYLVPASQTVSGLPVGWCATNSKGTVACAQQGEGAPQWNGQCRGAQPPYANDVCAPGDFNCDGKAENPTGESCACQTAEITCPTAPLTTVPYPPPGALPLEVNAAAWFSNPADVANASDWTWSMTGGDCDNILPNPTFGLYTSANGTGAPVGTMSKTLGTGGNEHGTVATGATMSAVYPAFSLSGDYVLDASWKLNGKTYTCSVQIKARAPGLRAEGCWDTETVGDDVDLHMAKVNGFTQCATTHAWSDLACTTANEDCYYANCYAGGLFGSTDTVNWGYSTSPATSCNGWGSQTTGGNACGNPRLDRDANGLSGVCDPTVSNPNGSSAKGPFCGPENINLDAPGNGDEFAVGIRYYTQRGTANARVHVNIYCDGARVLTAGYDPLSASNYPQLATAGEDGDPSQSEGGDMWKVALVTTTVTGGVLSCNVVPTQSKVANPALDGPTTAYCVDDATANGPTSQEFLTAGGGAPATANALCFH